MTKVLFLMSELFHGGAETQFRNLVTRLDPAEFKVHVVVEGSYSGGNVNQEGATFVTAHPEISFHFLKRLTAAGNSYQHAGSLLRINLQLLGYLRKIRPDIVLLYSVLGLKAACTCKALGAKVIFSERNSGAYPLKFYRNNRPFLSVLSALVCNSMPAMRNYQNNGVDAQYIPNGVEVGETLPQCQDGVFRIVVPARIIPVKNQEVVIRAVKLIRDLPLQVEFVGKAEDSAYKEKLVRMIDEYALNDRIVFRDFTQDVRQMYGRASLIILPSTTEGFANVILESYAYGRRCLISDTPMNRAVMSEGQRTFAPSDHECLARLIREEMALPESEALERIRANHAFVCEQYSMDRMVERYRRLFKQVCA